MIFFFFSNIVFYFPALGQAGGHGCRPFYLPVLAFVYIAQRVQHALPTLVSFDRMLLPRAFRESILHKQKSVYDALPHRPGLLRTGKPDAVVTF